MVRPGLVARRNDDTSPGCGGQRGAGPPGGLGQTEEEPCQNECGQAEDDERRPPRERRDVAGHGEAQSGADQLAGEHVAVDAAPLGAGEVVADEGRHDRAGRRGQDAQDQPGEQEASEGADGGAPDHRHPPEGDGNPEDHRSPGAVGEHPKGTLAAGSDDRAHGHEEPDVGIGDPEPVAELDRRGTDGRRCRRY